MLSHQSTCDMNKERTAVGTTSLKTRSASKRTASSNGDTGNESKSKASKRDYIPDNNSNNTIGKEEIDPPPTPQEVKVGFCHRTLRTTGQQRIICVDCGCCLPDRVLDETLEKRNFADSGVDHQRAAELDKFLSFASSTTTIGTGQSSLARAQNRLKPTAKKKAAARKAPAKKAPAKKR